MQSVHGYFASTGSVGKPSGFHKRVAATSERLVTVTGAAQPGHSTVSSDACEAPWTVLYTKWVGPISETFCAHVPGWVNAQYARHSALMSSGVPGLMFTSSSGVPTAGYRCLWMMLFCGLLPRGCWRLRRR
jgi:hypothetical protein